MRFDTCRCRARASKVAECGRARATANEVASPAQPGYRPGESGRISRKENALRRVALTVNGEGRELDVEPRELLVYVLRERLGLTGTKVGCDTSSCGACTVLLDGESVKSCTVLGVQADGHEIVTIEGLAGDDGGLHPVQESFHRSHALQCGYCTPGMVLATVSLLDELRSPSEEQIRSGLEGNLCRCTGYHNIVRAVQELAR